ncbi:MAG TPA: hypothetical protein VK506_05785 [Conexibacter sp.]|nr:hypothetical protein [Conexibacter sp.]
MSDAQAFTAAAVSTSSIDIGTLTAQRDLGDGESVGFAFQVDVAASATTVKLEVIMATDAALTAGIVVLVEETRLAADLPAGGLIFLAIPPGAPAAGSLRFYGVRVTPAGGAATVTLTAFLTPRSMFSKLAKSYARGYTV